KECLPCSSYVSFTNALPWSNSFFEAQSLRSLQLALNFQSLCSGTSQRYSFILQKLQQTYSACLRSFKTPSRKQFELWSTQTASAWIRLNAKHFWISQPTCVKTLHGFLGYANFYQKFIKNYSKTIVYFTSLLQKDTLFFFTEQASKEFKALKNSFTTAPVLAHFIGGILCSILLQTSSILWLLNLEIYKIKNSIKLLITRNFWKFPKFITCRQAQWAEFFSEFHFTITS
ncbi:hypothetical protein VP01_2803g2, partial [Puccinia sorghi]